MTGKAMARTWQRLALAAIGAALAASLAQAAEYRSVVAPAAVLYDAPSTMAKKLFIAPYGMPVEVLTSLPAWIKVRDVSGDVLWVARADLGPATQVATRRQTTLRAEPSERSPVTLQVAGGVLLELLGDEPGGWIKVRHVEGVTGYVKTDEVFGH